MRILLVEDDLLLGDATRAGLIHEGYVVDWLTDGLQAESALKAESFDSVILDLSLPGKDGIEVMSAMRDWKNSTPVLILTARDSTDDCIRCLDAGADDYLIKPFDIDELMARLRAMIRRSLGRSSPEVVVGDVILKPALHEVYLDGVPIKIFQREFSLLQLLMERAGQVLSRSNLEEHLYGWSEEMESNVLEVHIHNLRKKLGKSFIKTIRGVGYTIHKND